MTRFGLALARCLPFTSAVPCAAEEDCPLQAPRCDERGLCAKGVAPGDAGVVIDDAGPGGDAGGGDFFCVPDGECRPLIDLDPAIARRSGSGPFDVGVALPREDRVRLPRGAAIAPPFYAHADSAQGTLVFWLRPGWDLEDLPSRRVLLDVAGLELSVDPALEAFVVEPEGADAIVFEGAAASLTAGQAHFIALR